MTNGPSPTVAWGRGLCRGRQAQVQEVAPSGTPPAKVTRSRALRCAGTRWNKVLERSGQGPSCSVCSLVLGVAGDGPWDLKNTDCVSLG